MRHKKCPGPSLRARPLLWAVFLLVTLQGCSPGYPSRNTFTESLELTRKVRSPLNTAVTEEYRTRKDSAPPSGLFVGHVDLPGDMDITLSLYIRDEKVTAEIRHSYKGEKMADDRGEGFFRVAGSTMHFVRGSGLGSFFDHDLPYEWRGDTLFIPLEIGDLHGFTMNKLQDAPDLVIRSDNPKH